MADPMCPAESAAKAMYEAQHVRLNGCVDVPWEECMPGFRIGVTSDMRAALRALAEMEPTEKMRAAVTYEAESTICAGELVCETGLAQAYILAAAAEGEKS